MRVESMNYINTASPYGNRGKVANAEEIKAILFLGIKSDIPASDRKRKVDIII